MAEPTPPAASMIIDNQHTPVHGVHSAHAKAGDWEASRPQQQKGAKTATVASDSKSATSSRVNFGPHRLAKMMEQGQITEDHIAKMVDFRVQEIFHTPNWHDTLGLRLEATALLAHVTTATHGRRWYSCRQCGESFRKWSQCQAHVSESRHMTPRHSQPIPDRFFQAFCTEFGPFGRPINPPNPHRFRHTTQGDALRVVDTSSGDAGRLQLASVKPGSQDIAREVLGHMFPDAVPVAAKPEMATPKVHGATQQQQRRRRRQQPQRKAQEPASAAANGGRQRGDARGPAAHSQQRRRNRNKPHRNHQHPSLEGRTKHETGGGAAKGRPRSRQVRPGTRGRGRGNRGRGSRDVRKSATSSAPLPAQQRRKKRPHAEKTRSMKSAGGMRVPDEDELPPLPSPDMAQIHLEGFCPLRVPMRDCEALLRDLRKWKNKHARAMDMNSDVVPKSFKAVVAARKCVLLTAAVDDLYLRIRQQLSFFNHSKARSSPKKTAALQQKIREGTLSIRQASSQCGLRAVDALNVLVGKKSKRAQLRRHQTALLNALHQQREMHLDLARRTGEKPGWHAYNAAQKAKELAAVIQDNDKVFKEVDAVNDSVANAGDSGEELILSVLLEKCGVKRDDFWTEAELKAQNAAALKEGRERPYLKTPDFLFKKTVSINGRCVRWIDSKNNLIVPGVTIPPQITKYKRQINAYVDSFGPGMVLWHFCFFQSTQKLYSKPEMVFELSVPEAKEKAIAAGKAMYKRGVSIPCPLARAVIEAALEKDKQLTLEQLQTHEGAPDAAEATAP